MGLADFEKVSHAAENILDGMRHGTIEAEDQNIDLLLRVVDTLKEGMARYSENGNTEIPNCALLVEFLSEFNPGPVKPVEKRSRGENENLFPKMKDKTNGTEAKRIKRKDLRVDVDKLDSLVDLVGELVIAESMVLGNKKIIEADDEELERSVHHLKRVSSALQDVAMSVRMIPLSGTFKKMIRLVHDLAGKSGKSAEIVISGEDTEVDKNVIEEISDPIVHIIRNSVDHGLETPEERLREGKSQTGRISLDARHEGGEVRITVSDDGHGLDREKILKKAFSRDMISKDPGSLNDEEVFSLIFEPGFSTADEVTDVSGRGVGMDVVKKNIEKINGKINISSEKGKGTFITLHIPLTMAVIDGMLVKAGRQRFTLPLLSVKESVIASNYKITTTPDGRETVKLRNEILPVLRMEEVYNGKMPGTINNRAVFVIVEASSDVVALCVDEIIGQQEIVIKGLSGILGRLKGVSGCTVLGNGEVSLIADVEDLVRRAVGK
jgi:two-component system chemotaxis sensor kinase CheA